MGNNLRVECTGSFNYLINKTIFFMEKIEIIKEDIELWFGEGIILNKNQLDKLETRADEKCIKYIKKSGKRYIKSRKALEEDKCIEERYVYYHNYSNAFIKVLNDISEDENKDKLFYRDATSFIKGINERVEEELVISKK